MARPRKPVPTYRRHAQSGQAVVTVYMPDGRRRDILLGPYNSPESKDRYQRVLAELQTSPPTTPATASVPSRSPSVAEVLLAFWRHAEGYYRRPDGTPTNELVEYRLAIRPVRELYAATPARDFGPAALKAVRQRFADLGLSRGQVNRRTGRVKRVFKWAAGEDLVPYATFQALTAVAGLQKGRTVLPETDPVGPVAAEVVEKTLPHLPPPVATMVRFQLLTGCRPQDVCNLRVGDLDRSGSVWVYRPQQHKGAWRGKTREVLVGPQAQALLAPWLAEAGGGYVFSPARWVVQLHTARSAARVTPRYASHVRRNAAKRTAAPVRTPGERYLVSSYDHAVGRACRRAGVPHWHPNQLRHTFGTLVRGRYGLEAAQVALGHTRADVTQVYAERDHGLAARVAAELG